MALGTWDPDIANTEDAPVLDAPLLARLAALGGTADATPESLLDTGEQQSLAGIMQLPHEQWQNAAAGASDDDIINLIRFLALAENLPGWEAGANSPAIALAKMLRKRGVRLERDFLQWLRDVNDNRFLPYGPL